MIGGPIFSIFGIAMGFIGELEVSEAVGIFIFGLIMSGIGYWMFKGRK